ncbi:MAG: hypothetical protein FJ137_18810, partial [Deltaproteobacteria bacterium]|nr:hypothetical protein [Deltaproteobacteria bacterium]
MTQAEDFAARFDGFSIGSDDLTQLSLNVDRDAAHLATLSSQKNEAVVRAIRDVIRPAHAVGKPVGICGQASSDHADFAELLVQAGIDSSSLNPDSVLAVRARVAAFEARRPLDAGGARGRAAGGGGVAAAAAQGVARRVVERRLARRRSGSRRPPGRRESHRMGRQREASCRSSCGSRSCCGWWWRACSGRTPPTWASHPSRCSSCGRRRRPTARWRSCCPTRSRSASARPTRASSCRSARWRRASTRRRSSSCSGAPTTSASSTLLIEATAVDVADGSVRARQTALFPKGDQAT